MSQNKNMGKETNNWGKEWFKEIINDLRIWDKDSDKTIESLIGILDLNGKQFIRRLLKSKNQKLAEEIEKKKWTFIEGDIEMTEKTKKAIIRIHNQDLEAFQQKIKNESK